MQNAKFTVGIYTLGCKVNQYESEAIAEALAARGFRLQSPAEVCDFYIVNTCTVTAESDRKSRQMIRRALRRNPDARILVTGCLAQVAPEEIAAIPGVDFVCGNSAKLAVVRAVESFAACDGIIAPDVKNVLTEENFSSEKKADDEKNVSRIKNDTSTGTPTDEWNRSDEDSTSDEKSVSWTKKVLFGKNKFENKNALPKILCEPPDAHGFEPMRISRFDRTRAYIKIEDGCENRCAYCIIPAARGRVRSKLPEEVLAEAQSLTEAGCRELVLTGIETASYGKDLNGIDLADLLCRVDRIPGMGRVRLGSLDPSLMRPDFVSRIAALGSLAPHFHLSVQSGSDGVLARMRRKYNTRMALDGIARLRDAIPDVQLTADMIVGFPQETEEEFNQTLRFVEEVGFLNIHVFPYSERNGTPAASMSGQVPEAIRHDRAGRLAALQAGIRRGILGRMAGKTVEVLFETWKNGTAAGHTGNFIEVVCPSPVPLHARLLPVRILSNNGTHCIGELLPSSSHTTPERSREQK